MTNDTYAVNTPSPRASLAVMIGLFALAVISIGAIINRLGAMGDFWYVVTQFEDGILTSWQWDTSRPLVGIVWELMWRIFGYHFFPWYAMILVTQVLSAIVLWQLLWRYFSVPWTIAALVAAFMLVYPSDTARAYIVAMTNRHAILCCLLAAWVWLAINPSTSRRRRVALSVLCILMLAAGLLFYEGPLGLVLIFPVLVLIVRNGLDIGRRLIQQLIQQWVRLAVWYTGVLLFILYRLVLEPVIPKIINPQLVVFNLSPARITLELLSWPVTTLVKGWLYALVSLFRAESPILLISAALVIGGACFLLLRHTPRCTGRFYGLLIVFGVVLLFAASFPIIITSLDVSTMVGTLFGRTLSSAAFGHAFVVTGILGLLMTRVRTLAISLSAVLLSIATAGSVGIQYLYADVWISQLRVVEALQTYVPQLPDNTTVVLLDMPSGPYDIRYAFPLTRLVRLIYGNKTLQVAPWLANYPPDQQLFVFGDKSLVIVETLDHLETIEKPYQGTIAFRYDPNGPMTPVTTVTEPYLLPAGKAWFVNPKVMGRQESFNLTPVTGPSSGRPDLSEARPVILDDCKRLLNACK